MTEKMPCEVSDQRPAVREVQIDHPDLTNLPLAKRQQRPDPRLNFINPPCLTPHFIYKVAISVKNHDRNEKMDVKGQIKEDFDNLGALRTTHVDHRSGQTLKS
uniref:Uncharacterized protein n=1 Tax=Panagrellus redivivus TaxID=6233 RepID=A0A7E4VGL9_PANRE